MSDAALVGPPPTEAVLRQRAEALAGTRLGELAARLGRAVPVDLRRAKGWPGQLMEALLGATAASRAEPDFPGLGIELKTLPVDEAGKALESTFVCTIPLAEIGTVEWASSRVRRKLARVLWVPMLARREIPVAERVVGTPLLWSPNDDEEAALRADWEELAGIIGRGDVEQVTGHLGTWLQIRPKAASSRSRRVGLDRDGAPYAALPRGFYLRARFTTALLSHHFRT